jgi:hypothetical protein
MFSVTDIIFENVYAEDPATCIGVHCVTGLGRAPVLVAVALIELGMKYEVSLPVKNKFLFVYRYFICAFV